MNYLNRVATVGLYMLVDGRIPFVFGPHPAGDRLAVVRVGGHLEPGETPWQCAVREALEETTLAASYVRPPATYLHHYQEGTWELLEWPPEAGEQPLLVLPRSREADAPVNLMFLARATGTPQPATEVRGLLLLKPEEVRHLDSGPTTLARFRQRGGRMVLRSPVNETLCLEPGLQLRLLAHLLRDGALTLPDKE